MSDDIPTLSRAAGRQLDAETKWSPNQFQERVKARFYRRLEEMSHIYEKKNAFSDKNVCVELAGTERILAWLEDPAFASWFTDEDRLVDVIQANQERSLAALLQIMQDQDSSDGDKIKAARILLELGDKFPGRKQEVRFLDERLDKMDDREVSQEQQMLDAQLAQLSPEDPAQSETEDEHG